jgi:hypothetical protein
MTNPTPTDEKKAMNWDLEIEHDWGEGAIGPGRYQIDFGPLNFGMDGEEGIYCDDIEEVKRAQDAINSHDSLIKQRDELREAAKWAKAFLLCCETHHPEQSERDIARERKEMIEAALLHSEPAQPSKEIS